VNETKLDRRDVLKLVGGGAAGLAAGSRLGGAAAAPGTATRSRRSTRQGGPTLKLMTWGGPEHSQKRDAGVRAIYPDLPQVEIVVGGPGDFDVANALRLALASGEDIPDMVQFNRTQVAEFAAGEELLDLGDVYAPIEQDLYAGAIELVKYGDAFVCFPYELKSKMFFYRADLFQQAGIDPVAIATVTDFITAGKTLSTAFPNAHILNLGPQPVQYWVGELLSSWPDARFADDDGNYQITSHPGFAGTLTFLKDVADSGIALPIDDWSSDWQQSWADEAIAGSLVANWLKLFLPTFAPAQTGKWKATLWPKLDPLADQRYGSEAGGSVYVIPKRAKNTDAAVEYLTKMFLDAQGSLAVFQGVGTPPLLKSAKDAFLASVRNTTKPDSVSDADWAAQPANYFGPEFFDVELASYDYLKILPYDPSAVEEVTILVDWLTKFLAGDADLESALKGAQDDMESQIGNPYEV
jgi:multiple sugar transport system substrate-binding protein